MDRNTYGPTLPVRLSFVKGRRKYGQWQLYTNTQECTRTSARMYGHVSRPQTTSSLAMRLLAIRLLPLTREWHGHAHAHANCWTHLCVCSAFLIREDAPERPVGGCKYPNRDLFVIVHGTPSVPFG